MKIRCCVAYGFQESEKVENKENFWKYLDEEVYFAAIANAGFVLQFDGNLWAGSDIISGDPRTQNRNGKMFKAFLERHPHLTIVNSLPACEGKITRRRSRDGLLEESILDFFVVCSRILPYVKKMVIDENKKYILTNYKTAKGTEHTCDKCNEKFKGRKFINVHKRVHTNHKPNVCKRCGKMFFNVSKATDSDHNTAYMDLDLKIEHSKPKREEFFNFKNTKGQEIFKKITSNTSDFSKCFQNESLLSKQINNWLQVLQSYSRKAFKKIRIKPLRTKPVNKELADLIDKRNKIAKSNENEDLLEAMNCKISDMEAQENWKKLSKQFNELSDNPDNINLTKMWKILNKLVPKVGYELPTAKKNHKGKLISGAKNLKILLLNEYKQRLRNRPVRPDLEPIRKRKNKIFNLKMKLAKKKISPELQ